MKDMIALISGNFSSASLGVLTQKRPVCAMPFGGRYRLIDFALSNAVNSGIRTVGLIMPYNYRPLVDHLRAGKDWSLDRKNGGLFILPGGSYGMAARHPGFLLKDLLENREYLRKAETAYVLVSAADQAWNVDYRPVLEEHISGGADVTLLVYDHTPSAGANDGALAVTTAENGRVNLLQPIGSRGGFASVRRFADSFIISRSLLVELLDRYQAAEFMDFRVLLSECLNQIVVKAHNVSGFIAKIDSVESYYDASMALLDPGIHRELFLGEHSILTKEKDSPPSRFLDNALVRNSIISSGSSLDGVVENSVLFRAVQVAPGAVVRNCVVMQGAKIGEDAVVENAILDKFTRISPRTVIKGRPGLPVVLGKNSSM